ncbi:MAG: sugar ABC transporter permease [Acidimicrobiaceae bacterium]|nr:sugar ABC transporter permease [Acidimicrobiaceae bacterium]
MSSNKVTAAPPTGRRRRFSQLTKRDKIVLWVMVGIPTFLHVVLVWIPAILTGILSFMRWDNIRPVSTAELVGFRNYWEIFTIFDNQLFPALFNNLILMVWLFLCSAIGVLLAYLLDKNIKGTRFYQSVYYFPVVLSMAVVGFIWKSVMFNRDSGLLNILWPGKPVDFVGDQSKLFEIHLPLLDFPLGLSKNFAALLIAMAWRHIGYVMVLYLAGLKSFDPALREAAAIDGCNEWQTFRSVVFPGLKPINVVVAVITVIEALRAYDIVAALSEPRGTEVMGTLVTNSLMGEGGGYAGRGSAFGMVLFLLCIGFIIWYVINNFRERVT